ncbi:hypothetical protein EDD17DRAFT_1516715 [Pisolithus thermaeus]|nr:hypothetical protein EDD17DRAFT_1516715 [Pisolithus thermaeus]
MPNQNKPTSPIEEIEPHILHMWKAQFNDRQIVKDLHKLIDTNQYSIGNPQLILTYYLDVVEEFGFIPLVTQSDPGLENFAPVDVIWEEHQTRNMWSQLHQHFTPRFEMLLDDGIRTPGLVLPHGVPELIFSSPQDYSALDLKFMVDKAALKHICQLYVNTSHVVFDLVPRPLNAHLEEHYNDLGCPTITCQTIWHIYLDLLHTIQDHALILHLHTSLSESTDVDDELPLLKGQHDLPLNETDQGYYYMGGVGGGLGLGSEDDWN